MVRSLLPRLVGSLVLLIVVPSITFFIQGIRPTNVGRGILGLEATPQQVDDLNRHLGLDKPFLLRYVDWLGGAVHGALGKSYSNSQSVQQILAPRISVSLSLIIGALIVITIVGVLLGILSTIIGSWMGRVLDVVSTIGIAVPNFWLAVILATVFAVELGALPATGYVAFSQDSWLWFTSLILPVVALWFRYTMCVRM